MNAIATVPIVGKKANLPKGLASKLTIGDYDPEVAYVKAEAEARQAAQELAAAIEQAYPDSAEQVKEQLRAELDATGALDSDDVNALRKEAQFYRSKLEEIKERVMSQKELETKILAYLQKHPDARLREVWQGVGDRYVHVANALHTLRSIGKVEKRWVDNKLHFNVSQD